MSSNMFNDPYFGPTTFTNPRATVRTTTTGKTGGWTWTVSGGDWQYRAILIIIVIFSAVALGYAIAAGQRLRSDPLFSSTASMQQAENYDTIVAAMSGAIFVLAVLLLIADFYTYVTRN